MNRNKEKLLLIFVYHIFRLQLNLSLVSYHPNQPTVDIGRSLNHEQRILRDCEAMSQGQKYGFDLN